MGNVRVHASLLARTRAEDSTKAMRDSQGMREEFFKHFYFY
jgi:hypothetical protein